MILKQILDCGQVEKSGIDPKTVMSVDSEGKALSLFEHDCWDFSYQQGQPIYFNTWSKAPEDSLFREIKDQMKILFFILIATPETRFRQKFKSYNMYLTALKKVARLAHKLGISLGVASKSSEFQVALRQSIVNSLGDENDLKSSKSPLASILKLIYFLENRPDTKKILPVSLIDNEDLEDVITLIRRESNTEQKRTSLMPSSVYARLIDDVSAELSYLEGFLEDIKRLFVSYYSNPYFFVESAGDHSNKKGKIISKNQQSGIQSIDFPSRFSIANSEPRIETSKKYGLFDLFKTRCKEISYGALVNYLSDAQKVCGLACLLFSGMRTHELQVMPYDCLERISIKGYGDVLAIKTRTSKLNNGEYSKEMLWVTNEVGAKAIRIAQTISECFYMHIKGTATAPDKSILPLWISSRNTENHRMVHFDYPLVSASRFGDAKLLNNLKVSQEDIDELETFDAFRDWEIAPGQTWPYANHQCRRALVVYAARSGMVSLPSLGSQLKHLSLYMTAMYSENSSFAENFILDEGNQVPESHAVVREFREQQVFNMSISFHENVIAAKARLSGGTGKNIQKAKDESNLPEIMNSPEATQKAIEEGRMVWWDTVVGGCTRKGKCEAYGVDDVVPCVFGCPDAVLWGERLKAYASELVWGLEDLDEGSPAYKTTERELKLIEVKLIEEEGIES
ncbi:hypothetical protein ACTXGQ_18840 [Marinobacter sp. 1Y8]